MGRLYSVNFSAVAVTAQQDLMAYVAPSTMIAIVHSVELTQTTDVGDAQAEGLSILHKRGATTVGSGGGSMTPVPLEPASGASVGTARINDTTPANTGTIVTVRPSGWIIQQPYIWTPTPECRHYLAPGQRYVVGLATTPADSITVSGEMIIEELG